MIRQHLVQPIPAERDFRWRGAEISRLEGFSDAVFAFAVTLLVVSLEVPRSFRELMDVMRGFAAFGVCFALLAVVWVHHCRFFRRYGLQDSWTVFLNCVLLFFALFYVYPLKFLFFGMFSRAIVGIEPSDTRTLFAIYGAGYAAVFLTFGLLYLHAWRKRDLLELNEIESLKTRNSLIDHFAMVIVGLISVLLALLLPPRLIGLAGYFYLVIGLYFTVARNVFARRERRLRQSLISARGASESSS